MSRPAANYFESLATRTAEGWNHFWFEPSDAHSLSVLRILTGLVALYLHVALLGQVVELFGPRGMLPAEVVGQLAPQRYAFSLYTLVASSAMIVAIHVAGAIILGLFTVGLYTRVTSILSLVVMLSLFHRAPMLTSQAEPVVAMVLLYLCLGPCGAYYSLDRLFANRRRARQIAAEEIDPETPPDPPPSWTATVSTRLIQVHLVALYVVLGLAKVSGVTWWDGTAAWWLLARPDARPLDLTWLSRFPKLVNFWTHAIVLVELAFPVLVWNRMLRPLLLGIAAVLWAGHAALTGQLAFAAMMIVAGLAFVPPEVMRSLAGAARRSDAGRTRPVSLPTEPAFSPKPR